MSDDEYEEVELYTIKPNMTEEYHPKARPEISLDSKVLGFMRGIPFRFR